MVARHVRGWVIPWCQLLSVMVCFIVVYFPGRLLSIREHSWYKRSEFGLRAAIFFSAATVSGAFGGLLAVRIDYILSVL